MALPRMTVISSEDLHRMKSHVLSPGLLQDQQAVSAVQFEDGQQKERDAMRLGLKALCDERASKWTNTLQVIDQQCKRFK